MPHQCVRCNSFFEDGADELLKGCSCGAKLFFYIRQERFDAVKNAPKDVVLSDSQKQQIEQDVLDIVGKNDIDVNAPVILDLESVRVVDSGKYELDLVRLFNKAPMVIRMSEGKYVIDIANTFKRFFDSKDDPKKGRVLNEKE